MKKNFLFFLLSAFLFGKAQNNVGIGTNNPKSSLDISGSLGTNITTVSGATPLTNSNSTVVATPSNSAVYTITLPALSSSADRIITIIYNGSPASTGGNYAITIAGAGSDGIVVAGAAASNTYSLTEGSIILQNNGGYWYATVVPASSGSNNYIWNQTSANQTAGYKINGAATVGGLLTGNGGFNETGAANINTSGSAATSIGTGTNTVTENGNVSINSGNGAAATNIGTGSTTGAITIGGTAAQSSGQTINIGSNNNAANATNITGGSTGGVSINTTNSGTINVGDGSGGNSTVNVVGLNANSLVINSSGKLSSVADVASGSVLTSAGTSSAPGWASQSSLSSVPNIYNSDGTLQATRTVTMGSDNLIFNTTTTGGDIVVGSGEGTNSAGGGIIRSTNSTGTNAAGSLFLQGGSNSSTGSNGNVYVRGGYGTAEGAVYLNDDHGGSTYLNDNGGIVTIGSGTAGASQLSVTNGLVVDNAAANTGSISNANVATGNGITFGSGAGEGIASNRASAANGNQFGLDLYTNFIKRVSITNGGNVVIGSGEGSGTVAGGTLRAPNPGSGTNVNGGSLTVTAGYGYSGGNGGSTSVSGGSAGSNSATNGALNLYGGYSTTFTTPTEGTVNINTDHAGPTNIGGTETVTGLVTDNGGYTEVGAVNINTTGSSNPAANINTNSTGTVTIGDGTSPNSTVNIKGLANSAGVYTTSGGLLTTSTPSSGTLGYWTRSGTDLYNTNQGDFVGIGTTSPNGKLTISGVGGSNGTSGGASPTDGIEFFSTGNSNGYSGWAGRIYGDVPSGGWGTVPFTFSVPNTSGGELKTMALIDGTVGVATQDPTIGGRVGSEFTVISSGTALALGYSTSLPVLAINPLSNGSWTAYDYEAGSWTSGITHYDGRVGINNTTPYGMLETVQPSGVYSWIESNNNGIQTSTGHTTSDWTLYMGADKTNHLAYIQSVQWGTATSTLALNARGGNVGIGKYNPGYALDVSGVINASSTVKGSGFQDENGDQVIDAGAGWHRSYGQTGWYNGTYGGGWYMNGNGWVSEYGGQGVYISGGTGYNEGGYDYYAFDGNCWYCGDESQGYATCGSCSVSLLCGNRIEASEFDANSDARIKHIRGTSDKLRDLETLNKLRVADYSYIDVVRQGSALRKGFIAQEVEKVFPEAVSKAPDFIPNVYARALAFTESPSDKKLDMVLPFVPDLKECDKVRITTRSGDKEGIVDYVDGRKVTVSDWEPTNTDFVFVYGKQVPDFRRVDYDRIHTLGISAIQELSAVVDTLKANNEELLCEKEALVKELNDIRQELNGLKTSISNQPDVTDFKNMKSQLDELRSLMEKNGIRSEK